MAEYRTFLDPEGNKWNMRSNQPSRSYGMRFVTMFPEKVMPLAADPDASSKCFPVLIWCFENLSFDKFRLLNQGEVANSLNTSRASVGRAIKDLLARDFVERRGSGPRQEFRLTPEACWMGNVSSFHKAQRERMIRQRELGIEVVEGGRMSREVEESMIDAIEFQAEQEEGDQ